MPSRQHTGNRRIRRRKPRRRTNFANVLLVFLCFFLMGIMIVGGFLYIKKYAPTREKMPLDEYYTYFHDDEAVIIIDDVLIEPEEGDDTGFAIVRDGKLYLERSTLKSHIDDRYVFDDSESVMRYVTASDVVSVPYDSSEYSVGDDEKDTEVPAVISAYDHVFVECDFAGQFSDFTYSLSDEPYRATIYNAGYTRDAAKVKRKSAVRRLGGPKSKVLTEVKRNDVVSIVKNHGKWSNVVTEDGVTGYIQNNRLGKSSETTVAATLKEPEYQHSLMDKKVMLTWDMVMSESANEGVAKRLAPADPINVMSPTWFNLMDNKGGIEDRSSAAYVRECHDMGVEVWGLINDIEIRDVDPVTVLCTTSVRDRLVDNLMSAALSCGMDGINIDFEHIPMDAVDGYLEFIRELSLRCHENDLRLSVDNYAPAPFNEYYNRHEQSLFADYIILMAYDEHYGGGEEAGSNCSLPFLRDAVEGTLNEVPADQFICALPFYCREWLQTGEELDSKALEMDDAQAFFENNNITPEWDEDLGLYYGEYTEGKTRHMVWAEDERSFTAKMDVVKEYGGAGYAFWRVGHEIESIWSIIAKYE